uniref:Uncharacterized protein n=1 Tax=Anopheles merus TaxID=30066 RepID=A0A182UYQ0_ANOME
MRNVWLSSIGDSSGDGIRSWCTIGEKLRRFDRFFGCLYASNETSAVQLPLGEIFCMIGDGCCAVAGFTTAVNAIADIRKKENKKDDNRLIALANRTRKSRYSILPPIGTRLRYISRLIRHRAFPFMGNFCASSGLMSSPSDWARLMSHVHTFARVQSRGSTGSPSAPYWIFLALVCVCPPVPESPRPLRFVAPPLLPLLLAPLPEP